MLARFLVLLAALFSISFVARADVIYTYTVESPNNIDGTYVFDEQSILTSITTIPSADFSSSTGTPLTDLIIDPVASACPGAGGGISMSCVQVVAGGDVFTQGFLPILTSPGTYIGSHSPTFPDSLVISETPEPNPFSLLLIGLVLVGTIGRKRISAAANFSRGR